MRVSRTAANAAVAAQIVLLTFWAWAQISTLRGLINDARQPGAANYGPSLVIAGVFAVALLGALIGSSMMWLDRVRNLNLVVRVERGVIGLAAITAFANQALPSWPVVAAALIAALLFFVALRTRFE